MRWCESESLDDPWMNPWALCRREKFETKRAIAKAVAFLFRWLVGQSFGPRLSGAQDRLNIFAGLAGEGGGGFFGAGFAEQGEVAAEGFQEHPALGGHGGSFLSDDVRSVILLLRHFGMQIVSRSYRTLN
jgi:hypothetical protein